MTLENAFEFHERGVKDVMDHTMDEYKYQTLRDTNHGSRVVNTWTPSGITAPERKFVIRSHDRGSVMIPHLAKVRMSFKVVKDNATPDNYVALLRMITLPSPQMRRPCSPEESCGSRGRLLKMWITWLLKKKLIQ